MLRDLLARPRGASQGGTTALIVTHDLPEAIFVAQRVLFVHEGKIEADLRSSDVHASQIPAVQQYVQAVQRFQVDR